MVSFERDAFSVAVRLAISWSVTCAMIFDAESRYHIVAEGVAFRCDGNKRQKQNSPKDFSRRVR
jgi:hypothetical protein